MEQLYRAIVGSAVEPVLKGDELPVPYSQSVHRPLAPAAKIGDLSEEPAEDVSPISDSSDTPI